MRHQSIFSVTGLALVSALLLPARSACDTVNGQSRLALNGTKASSKTYDPRLAEPFLLRRRPSLGSPSADIIVVEVRNLTCDHCKRFGDNVLPDIQRNYIDKGKLQWMFLDIPNHPQSPDAIDAISGCAFDQNLYPQAEKFIYAHFEKLMNVPLADWPLMPGLDLVKLQQYAQSPEIKSEFQQTLEEIGALKIKVAPTFFFFRHTEDGRLLTARVDGEKSFEYIQRVINQIDHR